MGYSQIATEARKKVLEMIYKAQTSHIGSNFSVIDILTVLYEKAYIKKEDWENRDRIILSKGWAAASLYFFLFRKGLLSKEELESFCQKDSRFIGLAEPVAKGIEFAGGSMGHGLPAGVGMALAAKKLKKNYKVYVVMSDGELQCGTTWESSLLAQQYKLDNLYILVDSNGWQAMGKTKEILRSYFPLKYPQVVVPVDGHNHWDIQMALEFADHDHGVHHVINCLTTKGKGVSFMEDKLEWHYKNINDAEYKLALNELS